MKTRLAVCCLVMFGLIAGLFLARGAVVASSPAQLTPTSAAYLPMIQRPVATTVPTVTPTDVPGLPAFDNAGFEDGHTGWTEIPGNALITQVSGITPHTGTWLADLGGERDSRDEIQQTITLPLAAPLYLRYYRQVEISSGDLNINEFSIVVNTTEIKNDTLITFDSNGQWEVDSIDLSAYAGQTITLRLRIYTDDPGVHVYLDDIGLSSHP